MPWGVAAAAVGALGSYQTAKDSGPGPNYGGQLGYAAQLGYGKQTKDVRQGGKLAYDQYLNQLGLGTGPAMDITQIPGYAQTLQQGINAVNQGGAGAGMLMSGDRLKGLQETGMNTTYNFYQDYMNKLMGLSNMRQNAIQNRANLMSGFAANAGAQQQAQYGTQSAQNYQMGQDVMGNVGGGLGSLSQMNWGSSGGGGGGGSTGGGMEFNLSSIGL